MLDLLTIYIGEIFRKHLGGKWVMDTEDLDNAYYMMQVLANLDYKGEVYKVSVVVFNPIYEQKELIISA